MPRAIIWVLAPVIFLAPFRLVSANLVINEFVSDLESGSEWLELLDE